MSRIGKNPVAIPDGVEVKLAGQIITAKGKLGQGSLTLVDEVSAEMKDGKISVMPRGETRHARNMWGTSRSLVNNLVRGVSSGFTENLEINGVGYRAAVQGKELVLQLGYTHEIKYPIPAGVTMKTEKPTTIAITGPNKQQIGQIAAELRSFRPPEPYKGKGVKYESETIVRKEGKKKVEAGMTTINPKIARKRRIRARLRSVANERPRLSVHRTAHHIYAQVIDDFSAKTLAAASTLDPDLRSGLKSGGNIDAAKKVGQLVAERAKAAGVVDVRFDRGAYIFHGRIRALADAAREAGLNF